MVRARHPGRFRQPVALEDCAIQLVLEYDPQPPFGGIDYQHLKRFPRLLRGIYTLKAPLYTGKARRRSSQEGKATAVQAGKEQSSDLVGSRERD